MDFLTYSNNSSPDFRGMVGRMFDRIDSRAKQKAENDAHAKKTQETAESMQTGVAQSVPQVGQNTPRWGVDHRKKPLREDWPFVGQPRQFGKAPRVLRPSQPSQSEYLPDKPKQPTPTRIKPGVSGSAVYPKPPAKPRAPRKPRGAAAP